MSTGEYRWYYSQSDDEIPAHNSIIVSYRPVIVVPLVIRMDTLIAVKASGFASGIARSGGSVLECIPIKRGVYRSQWHKYSEICRLRYSAMSSAALTQIPGNGRHAPLPPSPHIQTSKSTITIQWVTLLLCISEVQASNLRLGNRLHSYRTDWLKYRNSN